MVNPAPPDTKRDRRPQRYEQSIGRLPREAVGGYNDLEEGRLQNFFRWGDRLNPPWGTLLIAGIFVGMFAAVLFGLLIIIWSKGAILELGIGVVIVGFVVVVSAHLVSEPGGPRG